MKNLILLFMIVFLTSGICSCRSKKSTTDFKHTETENVSIVDNSTVEKKETIMVNNQETKTEVVTDKSFFEAWMSFESDKITITDNQGNKTEITNPRINKKSSQTNDVSKSDQTDIKQEKSAVSEENQQNNVAVSNNRQIKTELQKKDASKGKEPVWLYVVGAVVLGGLAYGILKKFNLIKFKNEIN
ncbi:hypothetical protein [Paenimyroides baculatum]|uniref:Lipoprotein n=1 Tax=Paenimyroides baculatum TaxID=2608000 RepID=A0A5M6CCU0_9FLAO|nr:hypothetical protein [Paenimyroides baculatum]KAA5532813.1 hypothetical protein F0460_13290 [Paenimyroides baculatum]